MADQLKFWTIYLLILGAVLFTGWRQPISYRFKSQAEIHALENPSTPSPSTPWMWNANRKTMLDREAYSRGGSTGPNYRSNTYNNYNR
jgi:hypothetical protein